MVRGEALSLSPEHSVAWSALFPLGPQLCPSPTSALQGAKSRGAPRGSACLSIPPALTTG